MNAATNITTLYANNEGVDDIDVRPIAEDVVEIETEDTTVVTLERAQIEQLAKLMGLI